MLRFSHYLHECPVCGRPLKVRVQYRGCRVVCWHCGGEFIASDPAEASSLVAGRGNRLLRRAEQLLNMSARRLALAHGQTGS